MTTKRLLNEGNYDQKSGLTARDQKNSEDTIDRYNENSWEEQNYLHPVYYFVEC